MKIGVIFCAWQSADLLEASLSPWVKARQDRLGGHEYVICAVSAPFRDFPQDETKDATQALLADDYLRNGKIDGMYTSAIPLLETEIRGNGLRWLLNKGVDTLIQIDSDEVYAQQDIERIFAFVNTTPFIPWFRVSLRNAVFNKDAFLAEPFTPPRIHRVKVNNYKAYGFWDDNNITYRGTLTRDIKRDVDFASMVIPTSVAWPTHLSWLSDLRSKKKIEYQTKRGWECSFRWDEQKGLQFNEAYYAKRGLALPEVFAE